MSAHKFVKQYGWVESKMYLQRGFDVGVYVDPGLKLMIHQSICDPSHSGLEFCFHRNDLKRIVESHELVNRFHGLGKAKRELQLIEEGSIFRCCIAITAESLKQAIADVEACQ